jgi:dipeptidyl aminopeptidase/acylaminoacyl peptidase
VVWGESPQCATSFLFETLAGVVTGCRVVPQDLVGGAWSFAADGSAVGNGQGSGPAASAPVTLIRPDGQVVVLDSNPNDFDPSLSPDGSKVVFARAVPQNYQGVWPSNLYVVNTDGSGLTQVASGGGSELSVPTFSPDGSTIAYSCEPTLETGLPGFSVGCGPLPDGSFRAFATLLVNADGSDKRVILINQATRSLSWSADGQWIATESVAPCTCTDGSGPLNTEVFVYHTDGSDLFNGGDPSQNLDPDLSRQVTHETDKWGADLPQFVPGSSSQLVYLRPLDDSGAQGNWTYMTNVDGTNRQELSLSNEGMQWGEIVPAATGAGPPPFVNVMRVPVPSVRSLSYQAAKLRLQSANLSVGNIHRQYSSRIPRNHVLAQYPRGGGYAHRTTREAPGVTLTLSRGRRK